MLGLFLDYRDLRLQATVGQFVAEVARAKQMVDALAALGVPISLERLRNRREGSVGRPHVAQALLEAPHPEHRGGLRAIHRARRPTYFDGFRLAPRDAVDLVHGVGGLAVWAHPLELDGKDWHDYLPQLLDAGVDGLEAYYSKDYGPDYPRLLLEACAAHGLVPTVGSDFHGFASMDRPPGSVAAPNDLLVRLEARLERIRAA